METTEGTLLDGRVSYAQPRDGYRTGIEPVMLAASIPAEPGQVVLEAGTGAGAGLLCLGHRVAGLVGTGIERDPSMAALARRNLAANGLPYTVLCADVMCLPAMLPADHVFANPPWHDPAGTLPRDARVAGAKHGAAEHGAGQDGKAGLAGWVQVLAGLVRPGGTLTFALPAVLAGAAMALLHDARYGRLTMVPLWPRPGRAAKLVLVQARHGAGPSQVAPGLTLHDDAGYTAAAAAILRGGEPITL